MPDLDPKLQDALHRGLAEELLRRLKADTCETCQRSAATPQELQAIRQFLTDNKITASAVAGSPLDHLVKRLPFQDPRVYERN